MDGHESEVSDERLGMVLTALGYPCDSSGALLASLAQVAEEQAAMPRMVVTEAGQATRLPFTAARVELTDEHGVTTRHVANDGWLGPVAVPGYYHLRVKGAALTLAVAPPACLTPHDIAGRNLWGVGVQIPSLRSALPSPFGGLGELDQAVQAFAARGADALAISPVHALFPGSGTDFSPYSPSSRLFLNGTLADPALCGLPPLPEHSGGDLIEWGEAFPRRLADLRALHADLPPEALARIAAEAEQRAALADSAAALDRHALFDALDCHFRPMGLAGWHEWPAEFHDPHGVAAQTFAQDHQGEVGFHRFVQWLARISLDKVQANARAAGMAVGLIADLAVGVRPGGSDTWAMGDAMLHGLTIGAPPDPLGPHGQNWGLTGYSPRGLARHGYAPWIALLRGALAHSGGIRIDHAFGLARLWVVPSGGTAADGAYLSYPFMDLMRLAVLESWRARALIIAEDLGTAPHGFVEAITRARMLGMRVLWFERAADHGYIGLHDYPQQAVAMTGTHDTQTVAGWWSGRDLDWAAALGRLPEGVGRDEAEAIRDWDRGLLWSTLTGGHDQRPAPDNPAPVVDAAVARVAEAPAQLAVVPLEDLLALEEQPNLPGTTIEHPNWRRRLAAPLADLLDEPATAARLAGLAARRPVG